MRLEYIEMPDGSILDIKPTVSTQDAARAVQLAGGIALYWYSDISEGWMRVVRDPDQLIRSHEVVELPPMLKLRLMLE